MRRQFNIYIDDEVVKKAREKLKGAVLSQVIEKYLMKLAEMEDQEFQNEIKEINVIPKGRRIIKTISIDEGVVEAYKNIGNFSGFVEYLLLKAAEGSKKHEKCKICGKEVDNIKKHLEDEHEGMMIFEYKKL